VFFFLCSPLTLCSILPAPQFQQESRYTESALADAPLYPSKSAAVAANIPPHGKRAGWIPRALEDFGDGGAYPEIHVAQYPLNMGRKNVPQSAKVLLTQIHVTNINRKVRSSL
jgi:SNW domain-containing protein 1